MVLILGLLVLSVLAIILSPLFALKPILRHAKPNHKDCWGIGFLDDIADLRCNDPKNDAVLGDVNGSVHSHVSSVFAPLTSHHSSSAISSVPTGYTEGIFTTVFTVDDSTTDTAGGDMTYTVEETTTVSPSSKPTTSMSPDHKWKDPYDTRKRAQQRDPRKLGFESGRLASTKTASPILEPRILHQPINSVAVSDLLSSRSSESFPIGSGQPSLVLPSLSLSSEMPALIPGTPPLITSFPSKTIDVLGTTYEVVSAGLNVSLSAGVNFSKPLMTSRLVAPLTTEFGTFLTTYNKTMTRTITTSTVSLQTLTTVFSKPATRTFTSPTLTAALPTPVVSTPAKFAYPHLENLEALLMNRFSSEVELIGLFSSKQPANTTIITSSSATPTSSKISVSTVSCLVISGTTVTIPTASAEVPVEAPVTELTTTVTEYSQVSSAAVLPKTTEFSFSTVVLPTQTIEPVVTTEEDLDLGIIFMSTETQTETEIGTPTTITQTSLSYATVVVPTHIDRPTTTTATITNVAYEYSTITPPTSPASTVIVHLTSTTTETPELSMVTSTWSTSSPKPKTVVSQTKVIEHPAETERYFTTEYPVLPSHSVKTSSSTSHVSTYYITSPTSSSSEAFRHRASRTFTSLTDDVRKDWSSFTGEIKTPLATTTV